MTKTVSCEQTTWGREVWGLKSAGGAALPCWAPGLNSLPCLGVCDHWCENVLCTAQSECVFPLLQSSATHIPQHRVQGCTNPCTAWSQPVCTTSSDPSTHPSCTFAWPQGCSGHFETTILFFLLRMTFRYFPNSSLSFKPDSRCPSQKISP